MRKRTISGRDIGNLFNKTLLIGAYATMIGVVGIFIPSTVYAAEVAVSFSIEQQAIFNIEQDDLPIVLESKDVPEEFIGRTCTIEVESLNNQSVHPGNDLTVTSSNGASLVFEDVERETDLVIVGSGEMELGAEVKVAITAVGGKTFSGGMNVVVTCPDEVEPEKVERCDATTGKIVTISEEEAESNVKYVSVDDEACQPDEQPTPPVEQPTTLPVTGATSLLSLFAGTTIAGTIGHRILKRQK